MWHGYWWGPGRGSTLPPFPSSPSSVGACAAKQYYLRASASASVGGWGGPGSARIAPRVPAPVFLVWCRRAGWRRFSSPPGAAIRGVSQPPAESGRWPSWVGRDGCFFPLLYAVRMGARTVQGPMIFPFARVIAGGGFPSLFPDGWAGVGAYVHPPRAGAAQTGQLQKEGFSRE